MVEKKTRVKPATQAKGRVLTRAKARGSSRNMIRGNVPVDTVSINDKGGSISAVLKQSIRGTLQTKVPAYGANLTFSDGRSGVFIAPGKSRSAKQAFSVLAAGKDRYIISLGDDMEVMDPFTRVAVDLIEKKFESGKLKLADMDAFDREFERWEGKLAPVVDAIEKKAEKKPSPK